MSWPPRSPGTAVKLRLPPPCPRTVVKRPAENTRATPSIASETSTGRLRIRSSDCETVWVTSGRNTTMTLFHIANGHATTRLFEAAGIAGPTSVWADPLHAGPVPAGLDDAALRLVRARFL